MGDAKQSEEKFVVERRAPDTRQNKLGTFYNSPAVSARVCRCVALKTETYMLMFGVGDAWFGGTIYNNHPNFDEHVMLGLAIEEINDNAVRGNARTKFLFEQWNAMVHRLNNTYAFSLPDNGSSRDSTEAEIKRYGVERFSNKIKLALELLFDAHYPEDQSVDDSLNEPERNDIRQSLSHNCFSLVDPNVKNVCWLAGSVFDMMLAHLFRSVLFYFLAIMKLYTTKQRYYVVNNLEMQTLMSPAGVQYRRVDLDFNIALHNEDRANSSDEEVKGGDEDDEEEEEEEEEEDDEEEESKGFDTRKRIRGPFTFDAPIHLNSDGEAQEEEVAEVNRPRPRPFFNNTDTFSSGSEGEAGTEEEEREYEATYSVRISGGAVMTVNPTRFNRIESYDEDHSMIESVHMRKMAQVLVEAADRWERGEARRSKLTLEEWKKENNI